MSRRRQIDVPQKIDESREIRAISGNNDDGYSPHQGASDKDDVTERVVR